MVGAALELDPLRRAAVVLLEQLETIVRPGAQVGVRVNADLLLELPPWDTWDT